jgi:hypothetical protein
LEGDLNEPSAGAEKDTCEGYLPRSAFGAFLVCNEPDHPHDSGEVCYHSRDGVGYDEPLLAVSEGLSFLVQELRPSASLHASSRGVLRCEVGQPLYKRKGGPEAHYSAICTAGGRYELHEVLNRDKRTDSET